MRKNQSRDDNLANVIFAWVVCPRFATHGQGFYSSLFVELPKTVNTSSTIKSWKQRSKHDRKVRKRRTHGPKRATNRPQFGWLARSTIRWAVHCFASRETIGHSFAYSFADPAKECFFRVIRERMHCFTSQSVEPCRHRDHGVPLHFQSYRGKP